MNRLLTTLVVSVACLTLSMLVVSALLLRWIAGIDLSTSPPESRWDGIWRRLRRLRLVRDFMPAATEAIKDLHKRVEANKAAAAASHTDAEIAAVDAELESIGRAIDESHVLLKDDARRFARRLPLYGALQGLLGGLLTVAFARFDVIGSLKWFLVAHSDVWAPIAAFVVGGALYLFRQFFRRSYGALEVMIGCGTAHYAATQFTAVDERSTLLLASALYVIVRGIDNFMQGHRAAKDLAAAQAKQDEAALVALAAAVNPVPHPRSAAEAATPPDVEAAGRAGPSLPA